MTARRLTLSRSLKAAMNYPKLAGPVPRLLVLESRYWLDTACANAARRLGWDVECVPVVAEGTLPREAVARLLRTLIEFRPDFLLSVNLGGMDVGGMFGGLFEDLGLPFVAWFVDDPRTIIMDRSCYATSRSLALTWERAYEPYLKSVGFPVVEYMPLAVDRSLFDAGPAETWTLPCTFVGNSMTAPAAQAWRKAAENTELADALKTALDTGRVTRETFAEGLAAILPEPLLSRLDAEFRMRAELALFTEATRRLRQCFIQALPGDAVCVFGDDGWDDIAQWRGGPVNYERDLAAVYRCSEINLNVTSMQMASAVNQRVFDCPAAGGFLLTDAQSSLMDLFDPDSEIVCYHSLDEAAALIREYRARPAKRKNIVQRARARVFNEHTYEHRLIDLEALVRAHFA
ncbi:MAG TPA: glycosyltransferase [Candidatus Hydrogenedentes bacterium]|nr:glycosyltransferase [Candidatus Hydrogenedentota bacterium]HRT20929.1 glycosyltransferase [Candidatus Hydrogenedentota bacterium]HRT63452.1 glycosyltransferase [Candidatus Hydrogenedentota bacterium]